LAESDLALENQRPYVSDDKIDLRQVFRVPWAGKWLIGGITLTAAVLAVIVSFMLPNIYRADVLLAPNDSEGTAGLSALASQAGGLASLVSLESIWVMGRRIRLHWVWRY
jgi:LPS O-antigen subunit length determinant protein (WzzB/FepE family)